MKMILKEGIGIRESIKKGSDAYESEKEFSKYRNSPTN